MTRIEFVAAKIIREDPSVEIVLGGSSSSIDVAYLYGAKPYDIVKHSEESVSI